MLSNACPKPTPRALEKLRRRAEETKQIKQCYQIVQVRDGLRCRVCGRRCWPGALAMLERAEHHHLIYRSRGGKHEPRNVLLVCKAICHDLIHLQGTLHLSGNADLRDEDTGKLCGVKVERLTEAGWVVEKFV